LFKVSRLLFQVFKGAVSCNTLYLFSRKKEDKKDAAAIRTMEFWLKNTFTVESYIFDKKQKKKFIRQSNPIKGC
jgi:hypothetical protein